MVAASQPATVRTFFYGSYINRAVLAEVELFPECIEVARLSGYDLSIAPLANLIPSDHQIVYGILAPMTHTELARLYAHAEAVLGGVYLPHPVVVCDAEDRLVPALCYIAPDLVPTPPDAAYVRRILDPAREYGFPAWYLERIEAFLP